MEPRERERRIGEWLDAALKQYGEAEPRLGLEDRILSKLQSADARLSRPVWWWPALAAVAAMLLVGVAMLIGRERHGNTRVQAPILHAPQRLPESTHAPDVAVIPQAPKYRRMARLIPRGPEANAVEPRLEQFPSPQPLSEQEQLLASYVRERPQEAGLVARARQQLRQQALLEMEKQNHVPEHSQEFEQ